ncbi:MAG TPA: FlgD immunoglobulin-like domain containing protein [Gaiellaceae bacterium]|nr:FlgD immunoglobulin-like domain containing protein [Gaiellaceae bacterium]
MARWSVLGVTLVLLAATVVAFGRIEALKLEKNPVGGPQISPTFSPVCKCSQRVAQIKFKLVKTGALTLTITTPDNQLVRTLVHGRRFRAGKVHFTWNGRDNAGKLVPDGTYRIGVLVSGEHRVIVLPDRTTVDTVPPVLSGVTATPATISPDGDHRDDRTALSYKVSEHAKVRVLVRGTVVVRGRGAPLHKTLYWSGTVKSRVLPAGTYRVTLRATDLAGNVSEKTVKVQIRFVELRRHTIRAKAGTRFGVVVESDARAVHWKLAGKRGVAKPGLLVLKAGKAGRHVLTVTANGHSARAVVVVTPRH